MKVKVTHTELTQKTPLSNQDLENHKAGFFILEGESLEFEEELRELAKPLEEVKEECPNDDGSGLPISHSTGCTLCSPKQKVGTGVYKGEDMNRRGTGVYKEECSLKQREEGGTAVYEGKDFCKSCTVQVSRQKHSESCSSKQKEECKCRIDWKWIEHNCPYKKQEIELEEIRAEKYQLSEPAAREYILVDKINEIIRYRKQ